MFSFLENFLDTLFLLSVLFFINWLIPYSSFDWQSEIESLDSVCIILGNESCDLDSAVCALIFAYFLEQQKKFASVHLPVLNVAKEEFILKTEVVYFLKRCIELMINLK